jgi:transposase
MIYVGMDVSFKGFMIHAITEKKKVVFKGEIPASPRGLQALLKSLPDQRKLFAFEAGNQMKWITLFLKEQPKVNIHVVHPNEVKWITESRGKTDKVDARKLAELARGGMLPTAVHIVEGDIRRLRELISARAQLQSKRVALINTIRGYVGQEGVKLPVKFFQQADWRGKLTKLRVSATLRTIIETFMVSIDAILEAEKKLLAEINSVQDDRIELLKTIPAIGEMSARVILSAIDDVSRFHNKKTIANYGALTPSIYQSGGTTHMGHVNRDGRHEVRRVLLQCAHTIGRMKEAHEVAPLKTFFGRVAKKRSKKIATVAIARKLLTTAYGVLKSGEAYDPAKLYAYAA